MKRIKSLAVLSGAKLLATGLLAIILLFVASCEVARADVFSNVPEAANYDLVYTLPIENQASYNISGTVPYSVDNSAIITSPFDRIAYYLELDIGSGLEYAYASMDAFTPNISQVGLPTDGSGANFQQLVSNLNVFSNSANVTTGTGISTGNIEFWPRNPVTGNFALVPGASSGTFDFGDGQSAGGDYGSLQIHNYGASQTILSYNQWGGEQPTNDGDLGIGNQPTGQPDWTLAHNAGNYTVKNLQVLVRSTGLSIDGSLSRAIFQRNSQNEGSVPVSGLVDTGITSIEARGVPRAGSPGTATDWEVIDASPSGGTYSGNLSLDGGWYDVEVRSLNGAAVVSQRTLERVGVGEVFVIAGQSNSANWGSPPQPALEDSVSAFDLNAWQHADDPQPIADGSFGGSPWPALGDALVAELEVPIGFISVGVGGSRAAQWLPGQTFYDDRLKAALQALGPDGARAVLWHQGEADNEANTSTVSYVAQMEAIIAQSRIDAGFDIPWGVAQASYLSYLIGNETDANVIAAQAQVAANDPLNFVGAFTDDMINSVLGNNEWRHDNIHFNQAGLDEHADRWFNQLLANVDFVQFIADFDSNDSVDAADLAAWIAGYGILSGAVLADGDADDDQDVDGPDFLAWQRNFGQSKTLLAASASSNVPEPTSLGMCLLGAAAGSAFGRNRPLRIGQGDRLPQK